MANDKLLKVAVIYGANASGKSNIYDAFKFMSYYVEESFKFGGESDSRQKADSDYIRVSPFLFDSKSRSEESTFEVFFVDNSENTGKIYQYGFALQNDEVVEEWFYSKAKTARNRYKTIFYRKRGEELEVNGLPKGFITSREIQSNVVNYFASFDNAICDFKVEEIQWESEKEPALSYKIDVLHKIADCNEFESIPLKSESSGMLKMFALYPSLKEVLDNGGTLFVDELNASLHPLLVRNIILTFLSPEINTNHAQMIFTTHGVWQLSNELLRRDEIWLVDKEQDGVSDLYSLADFKDEDGNRVSRDEALAKNYLTGSYGAIPALRPMEMLKGRSMDGEYMV